MDNLSRAGALDVTVTVVEPVGLLNWLDVDWNGVRLTGKGRGEDRLEAEGKGFAVFSPEKLLVFDAVSGRRVYGFNQRLAAEPRASAKRLQWQVKHQVQLRGIILA
jgi:hypothetical protein